MKPASLVLVVLALAAAPRASGDPSDKKATAAAEASGRAHFQRGQKLSARGDYEAAYREFAAGYALTERPLFLFNMAEAARAAGDPARARDNYQAFLRADPSSAVAATARDRLAELDRTSPVAPPAITTPPPSRDPIPLLPPSATQPSPVETRPVAVDAPPASRPIYKKWPFWAVVAGGVIAGGAIVSATTRETPACGGGCTQLNFR